MADFKLKRGFHLQLAGAARRELADAPRPATVAVQPADFRGVRLGPAVNEGDRVQIGTPILRSKDRADWVFAAPAAGQVTAVRRGPRRALEAIVITPDAEPAALAFKRWTEAELAQLSREAALGQLLASGMLWLFRERPFGYVANPDHAPRDIFVSTLETAPLGAEPALIVAGQERFVQAGLEVCKRLTAGHVHVAVDGRPNRQAPAVFTSVPGVQVHRFAGPHPAGCVGVQIHHIAPIRGRTDVVWCVSVQGLIILGKLFVNGMIDPAVTVAVAGSGALDRRHFRTVLGADVNSLTGGQLAPGELRRISGNVLTGRQVGPDGHVGLYDNLLTVIPEVTEPEFLGWTMPGLRKQSWFPAFLSRLLPGQEFVQHTGLNGGHRALVATGVYEDVVPMDILPEYLVKSCLIGDLEEMEQLGLYEVTEEEVALCDYVCPSKTEFQQIIRAGLDHLARES